MRSINEWFELYGESHQNHTNKLIHYVCVPVIFFSIVGLLMAIPNHLLVQWTGMNNPLFINWATVILIPILIFYIRLSMLVMLEVLIFYALCVVINFYISLTVPLWISSLTLFVVAWIGQFYGHKVEGKKPSFLNDLQFLLIGPAWIFNHWFGNRTSGRH